MTIDVAARARAILRDHPPESTPLATVRDAFFDAGLAWVSFPEGEGGLGLDPLMQAQVDAVLRESGIAVDIDRNPIGIGMVAPTIVAHGTPEQKERFLRPLYRGDHVWCQLFSEPGAGSDLAALGASALRDGDEWIVNGQKVWTTLAHVAQWGILLARTDSSLPKHAGITCFLIDMAAPGVDIRPLRQITGEAEFNEVFLGDVRIPDALRLGGVGEGWRVALTTLMNERVLIGELGADEKEESLIDGLVAAWRDCGDHDAARRDAVMRLWVAAEVNRLTTLRARQLREVGTPGPEGSVAKLVTAELNKRISSATLDVLGAQGMLYPRTFAFERPDRAARGGDAWWRFLRTRANSIEGGTSEIMRNILGERVLGLPGDVRVDREKPWSELPRG